MSFSPAPSEAPRAFQVFAVSTRSVEARWRLPPANSRNGILKGFKLLYKKKDSDDHYVIRNISEVPKGNNTLTVYTVNGLDENTEYQFQVLAFTSAGDGVKSFVLTAKTLKDGK